MIRRLAWVPLLAVAAAALAAPERIALTYPGDPSTTLAVTWRGAAGESTLQATTIAWLGGTRQTVQARSESLALTEGGSAIYHSAELTGLRPGSMVLYRVGGEGEWSPWLAAKTLPRQRKELRLIYFGDIQTNITQSWREGLTAAVQKMPDADALLIAGDLVDNAHSDKEWSELWTESPALTGFAPTIAATGNHEYRRRAGATGAPLSIFWRKQFAFPQNGPEDLEETAYHYDMAGLARVIVLNSNRMVSNQADYLEQALAENPNPWSIVMFHHPTWSIAKNKDNPRVRRHWLPIFEEHKPGLVLQGDEHAYARMHEGGTLYAVAVTGRKLYPLKGSYDKQPEKLEGKTRTFQTIRLTRDRIEFEAYTMDGEPFDRAVITKDGTGAQTISTD